MNLNLYINIFCTPKANKMILYIKNMVCHRCKKVVKTEFEKLGLYKTRINVGEVKIVEEISRYQLDQLYEALKNSGFELMDDQNGRLIGKIKKILEETVHYSDEQIRKNLPRYLSKKLNQDYECLARLFAEVQGITIENYIAEKKIEMVKELLIYYRLSHTEIAYQLNYNNVAHLTKQFKEVTGFSPSQFQKIRHIRQLAQV